MSTTINVSVAILAIASHAMAEKDVRYYLNGMMIERSEHGGVRVVATDGSHLIACRDENATIKQMKIQKYILPRDLVLAIVKSAKKGSSVEIKINKEGVIEARSGSVTNHSHVIEGKFPDWQAVIPTDDTIFGAVEVNPSLMRDIDSAYKSLCNHTGLSPRQAGMQWVTRGPIDHVMAEFGNYFKGIHCMAILMPMRGREIKSFKETKV